MHINWVFVRITAQTAKLLNIQKKQKEKKTNTDLFHDPQI